MTSNLSDKTRLVARAVIQKGDNILLCHVKGNGHYFLPGGGIEFCEGAEETLRREMQEELGAKMLEASFIGALENQYHDKDKPDHEIYLIFSVIIDDVPAISKEGHIDFRWMSIKEFAHEHLLPKHMVPAIVKWLKDGKMFWVGLNKNGD